MILVTGGTGMLGAQLLVQLTAKGQKIKALRRPTSDLSLIRKTFGWYSANPEKDFERIEWLEGDLLDSHFVDELVQGISHVYHCAAMVSFDSADRQQLKAVNERGTANLVNALLQVSHARLCHVSSIAAIGSNDNGSPADENTPWKYDARSSAYSISKYHAEREVWRGIAEGLDAVIVNPSVILGPGSWHSGSSALFSVAHKGMPFFTKGTTGYVDVRDVAVAMIRLMESPISGERYIVSAGNLSYQEFFNIAALALGSRPPRIEVKPWMSELAWRYYAIKGYVEGKKPAITRETARNAQKMRSYTSDKLIAQTGMKFIPPEESIKHYAALYLSDQQPR
ncbi:MAG TPA: NAD-dependent epimerase/dehydratase family protein [Bacteroidales bacterium]|nr:NAD-dependent epimerase/dehydratase family protein [Bacteroidales bacterium]